MNRVVTRLVSALRAGAVLAGGVFGYGYDGAGVLGALAWAMACVWVMHVGRSVSVRRAMGTCHRVSAGPVTVPPELDAALRGLAHDLRSPIAAAAAAFAAYDDHLGPDVDDGDIAYLRGAVRRNLEKARARLRTLEEHRLQVPEDEQTPGLRQALAQGGGRR